LNPLLLFRDKVSQTPCAEKALKGLGRGSGGEPFSKRVSPSCSTIIPLQILICARKETARGSLFSRNEV
jgi:hypothetical protein